MRSLGVTSTKCSRRWSRSVLSRRVYVPRPYSCPIANAGDGYLAGPSNDIWASPSLDHTGLVIRVTPAMAGGRPNITIRHDSSGQGRVAENDFATYFHGHGFFYR